MARQLTSLIAALVVAVTALSPALAEARDHRRGGYDRDQGYDRGYSDNRGRGHYRHDNDDDDALAAGVIGLALGAIIGSAVTSSNQQRYYQSAPRSYYAPPPAYYPPPPPPRGYYGGGGYDEGRYASGRQVCVVRERQWDPYAGQYVRVERRVPC